MNVAFDRELIWLGGGVLAVLVVASIAGAILARRMTSDSARATVANLNARIQAWWVMIAVFAIALLAGDLGAVILFAAISFLALREFITLIPTRHGAIRTSPGTWPRSWSGTASAATGRTTRRGTCPSPARPTCSTASASCPASPSRAG